MDNRAIAQYRPAYVVERELLARQKHLSVLRDLVGEYASVDFRPFAIVNDHIEYTRELNIPANLIELMREEAAAVATLTHELHSLRFR